MTSSHLLQRLGNFLYHNRLPIWDHAISLRIRMSIDIKSLSTCLFEVSMRNVTPLTGERPEIKSTYLVTYVFHERSISLQGTSQYQTEIFQHLFMARCLNAGSQTYMGRSRLFSTESLSCLHLRNRHLQLVQRVTPRYSHILPHNSLINYAI